MCGGVSLSTLGKLRRTEHGPSPPQHYTLVTWDMHVVGQVNQDPSHHPPTLKKGRVLGFPGGAVVESLPANAGDMGSSPGLGRSHMPRSN